MLMDLQFAGLNNIYPHLHNSNIYEVHLPDALFIQSPESVCLFVTQCGINETAGSVYWCSKTGSLVEAMMKFHP